MDREFVQVCGCISTSETGRLVLDPLIGKRTRDGLQLLVQTGSLVEAPTCMACKTPWAEVPANGEPVQVAPLA